MVLKFIKKILKKEKGENKLGAKKELNDIVNFVDYVVRSLVNYPDSVKISLEITEDKKIIHIRCNKDDIGKIIGKNGRTISAIRQLAMGAASRLNHKVVVEVIEEIAN